jgi:chemotaxis protein histidine kinase CheA
MGIKPYIHRRGGVPLLSNDDLVLRAFLNETDQHLGPVQKEVAGILAQARKEGALPPIDQTVLQSWYQLFHTVNINAANFKFQAVVTVAGAAESMFLSCREKGCRFLFEHVQAIDNGCHFLRHCMNHIGRNGNDLELTSLAQTVALFLQQAALATPVSSGPDTAPESLDTASFLRQVHELIDTMEMDCLCWHETAVDSERLGQFIAMTHRFSMLSREYGFVDLEMLSRTMLEMLERFQNGEPFISQNPEEVFIDVLDAVRSSLHSKSRSESHGVTERDRLIAALKDLLRPPIGELLVEAGLVGEHTIQQALKVQETSQAEDQEKQLLGEVLVAMGEVTEQQVDALLNEQQEKVRPPDPVDALLDYPDDDAKFFDDIEANCKKLAILGEQLVNHEDVKAVQSDSYAHHAERFLFGVKHLQRAVANYRKMRT